MPIRSGRPSDGGTSRRLTPVPVRQARLTAERSGRRLGGGPIINRWALLAVPAIVFLIAFFLAPLVAVSLRSVTEFPKPTTDIFANYERFAASASNVRVLANTFWVAVLSTVVCLALGYPYAYLMNIVRPRIAGLLLIAVLLPFWSSLLVRTYAWQVILRDTGIINTFLLDMHWVEEPLPLIRTTLGVMLGMSQILLPFMVLPLYASMRRIDPELTKAAANLGARPFTAFRRVFLPLSMPGVLAGSLLVFVLALGFYITPALLGSPKDTMISQFIASAVQQRLDWGIASTMGVILLALALIVLFVASRFVRLRDVYGSLEES
ncbi:MAG: ABC transporter permease [Chloroflexota bacterium]|nr:MAG: ABC transporter permease [Chloroflexota bacterium]